MSNNFIKQFDPHKDIEVTRTKPFLPTKYTVPVGVKENLDLTILSRFTYLNKNDIATLYLDLQAHSNKDLMLHTGELSIITDNQKFSLTPIDKGIEQSTLVYNNGGYIQTLWFALDKSKLYSICNSSSLQIRIYGKNGSADFFQDKDGFKNKFIILCKQCYNEFYDKTKFSESQKENIAPKKGACFIATATMGDYDHPDVMELRHLRDEWILLQKWGKDFVNWYYYNGAIAARFIEKSYVLKKLSYVFIVKPLVFLSRIIRYK